MKRPNGYSHFAKHEVELVQKWAKKGKTASEISGLLDRDLSSVARRMKLGRSRPTGSQAGRPRLLSAKDEKKAVRAAERLIQDACGEWQVTAEMVRKALKLKCCDRVLLNALHNHNVYFHAMREKPVLTKKDIEKRLAFASEYVNEPESFWVSKVNGYMDNKFFTTYLNATARAYARKIRARGTFRKPGQGLDQGHVRPRKDLKMNFGPKVHVSVAISAAKVLTCHLVEGSWNAAGAEEMYKTALGPALKGQHPNKRKFLVLEDNDPAGYKSNKAKNAKKDMRIKVFEIPPRSPDLNPLDYGFWKVVNDRLRAQEAKFDDSFVEARGAFIRRLRRTILRIPASVLQPLVSNMKRRCEQTQKAAGGHFEEGS